MNFSAQKIIPNLWFDYQAEEAVNFYISIFRNSKILNVSYYGEAGPGSAGSVLTITYELAGQSFTAINGGPHFTFSPAISFLVHCESQEEIDELWEKLSEGGATEQCGWLQDKYGVSWQIIPTVLLEMLNDPNPKRSQKVMQAMLKMVKINMEDLEKAYQS